MPLAQISLTLFCHLFLSSIAFVRSSRLHLVSLETSCTCVQASRSTPARPCAGVHRRTSLMSSSLILQQYPARLVCLFGMVLEIGCWWLHNCCFVGCSSQDFFNIGLLQLPSSFFPVRFVSVNVVHPYSSMDMTETWKIAIFLLLLLLLLPRWLKLTCNNPISPLSKSKYILSFNLYIYIYIYIYIWCLNIHGTNVSANNSTNNNVVFFFSDLKIVYYNSYQSSITMPWKKGEIFCFSPYLEIKSFKTILE